MRLIETRFPCGEIQLLQFKAGDETIGFLYNFVLEGHVVVYQCAFQYEETGKRQPGLVCHTLAVEWNRNLGAQTYDFLAGDRQYKRSLGRQAMTAQWCLLQRDRIRFRVENLLRTARQLIRRK